MTTPDSELHLEIEKYLHRPRKKLGEWHRPFEREDFEKSRIDLGEAEVEDLMESIVKNYVVENGGYVEVGLRRFMCGLQNATNPMIVAPNPQDLGHLALLELFIVVDSPPRRDLECMVRFPSKRLAFTGQNGQIRSPIPREAAYYSGFTQIGEKGEFSLFFDNDFDLLSEMEVSFSEPARVDQGVSDGRYR